MSCDPKAEWNVEKVTASWGWVPMKWQNNLGSMIVVRQDKKPLTVLDVEALCKYCFHEIHPMMVRSQPDDERIPEELLSIETVLSVICRATFQITWEKVREQNSKDGDLEIFSLAKYPNPYSR